MNDAYLKSNILMEPLIYQWPAWLNLVSPLTSGFFFQNHYMKLLRSFVEYPQLHQQACKDPKLTGGFFVNLNDEFHEQANHLLHDMNEKLAPLIALTNDILRFNELMVNSANGQSLEAFYCDLPASLQGMVELLYDLNNRAHMRFIESILYHRYYDTSMQSIMLFPCADNELRPFILSTPRLNKDTNLQLNVPFHSLIIDKLASSREDGLDFEDLVLSLDLTAHKKHLLRSFFLTEKPTPPEKRHYSGQGFRLRYFGHACILLQSNDVSILIDPFLANSDQYTGKRYSYEDFPETIDYVLITHSHQDHCNLETLLQLRHKIKHIIVPVNNGGFLADPSIQKMLRQSGFNQVNTLGEFESIQINNFKVTGVPFLGEHGDLNIHSKISYHISIQEQSLLFAADSNNIDNALYAHIRSILGKVDTLFIGMECRGAPYSWVYGALSTMPIKREHDQSRRLSGSNAEKAWQMIYALGVSKAYVYAMGLEPWLSHVLGIQSHETSMPMIESAKLIDKCSQKGILCERLYLKHEIEY